MFERMPSRLEFGIFALMALACAAVVALFPRNDYAMMFAAMPVFLVAAIMGLRRSEQLKLRKADAIEPEDELAS
jgi:hypothetical protein